MLTIATKVITIIAFVNVEPLGYAMILEEKVEAGQAFVPRETTFPSPLIPNRKNVPTLPMMKETFDPPTTMLNDIEMVEARIDKTRVKEQDDSVRFVSQSNVNSTHAPTSTEMVKATRIKVKRRIKRKVKIPIKEREISRKIASRPMLKTTIPPTAARKPSGKGEVDFKHATMPRIKLTLPPMLLITALPPAATTKVPTAPPLRFVPTFNLMFQTADPIKKHVATSLNFKVTTPPHATEESVSLQPEDSVTDARLMIISTEPESEQDFVATGTLQNFEVTEPPSAIEESVSLPPLKMSSKEPKIDKFVPTFPPMFFVNTPDHTAKEIVTPFAADSPTETNFETSTGPNNGRFIPLLYQNDNSRTTESPTEGVMTPLSADNDADVNSVVQMVEPDTGAANASKGFELLMSDGMTEAGDGVNTATSNSEGSKATFYIETATGSHNDVFVQTTPVESTGSVHTTNTNVNTIDSNKSGDASNNADTPIFESSGTNELYLSQSQNYPSYTDVKDLYTYILNDYDTRVRPKYNQSQVTKVSVFFSLLNILDFKTATQTFDIVGYFYFVWEDEFLVWQPRHYSRTQWIKIPIRDIWTPQLLIANMYAGDSKIGDSTDRALVTFQGTVSWVPEATYRIVCEVAIEFYPFDTQTCRLTFYVSDELMSEVEMFVDERHQGSRTDHFMENSEWRLVKVSVEKYFVNDASYMDVTFTVQRRLEFIFITTIAPLLLVSVLNLCVFLIPVEAEQKGEYSATIVITYGVFISHISASVPPNSTTIPYFVLYMIWLLGFSVSTVIYSIIQSRLHTHYGKRKMGMSPFSICFGKKVKSKNDRSIEIGASGNDETDSNDTIGTSTYNNSEESIEAENKSHLWGDLLKKIDIAMILLYTISITVTTTYFFLSMNVSSYFQYL